MFPSYSNNLREQPRKPRRLTRQAATGMSITTGGSTDSIASPNSPNAAAVPVMQTVPIPIPFKHSTTAPSRFVGAAGTSTETEDFSQFSVSRNPFQQQRSTTTDYDDYSFIDDDYITFPEDLLPRTGTTIDQESSPDSTSGASTSVVSSQFHPSAINPRIRARARAPGKSKPKKVEIELPLYQSVVAKKKTDRIPSPSSSISVGSITSSIVKPIEIKFKNKNAVAGIRRRTPQVIPGLRSMLDAKVKGGLRSYDATSFNEDDNDDDTSRITLCSDIEKGVNTQMSHKTQADRDLMIKLCNEALKRRKSHLEHYSAQVDRDRAQAQAAVDQYKPDMGKRELQELILEFVTQREEGFKRGQATKPRSATCWHKKTHENDGHQYLPVYCLEGRTHLGRSNDHPRQPHTFANLSALKKPAHDPPGYRRFSKLINMNGFNDNEILIHARGNQIRVDGFALSKKSFNSADESAPDMLRTSKTVNLPKGVYPERLSIGRSSTGVLVIQEPWQF